MGFGLDRTGDGIFLGTYTDAWSYYLASSFQANARNRPMPSRRSGTETAIPSGKFWRPIPRARAAAPATVADGKPAAAAPKATPTANPSGKLWRVMASTRSTLRRSSLLLAAALAAGCTPAETLSAFVRLYGQVFAYVPVGKRVVWAQALRIGTVRSDTLYVERELVIDAALARSRAVRRPDRRRARDRGTQRLPRGGRRA